MSQHLWIAFTVMLSVQQSAWALEIPLHYDEAKIVEQIISVEGHAVEVAEVPGWAKGGVVNRLKEVSVETMGLKTWGVRGTKMNAVSFNCDSGMEQAAKITTTPPAEIVKRHSSVASRIAHIATGEAAEELKKAIAEYKANKKSSK